MDGRRSLHLIIKFVALVNLSDLLDLIQLKYGQLLGKKEDDELEHYNNHGDKLGYFFLESRN